MNAIQPIARTKDTVTLSLVDYEALLAALEDAQDIAILRAKEAQEITRGKEELRADNLSDQEVGRLLEGEHPIRIWREHRGLSSVALSALAKISRSDLDEIEAKRKPGSLQAYRRLAAALRVPIDDLVSDVE